MLQLCYLWGAIVGAMGVMGVMGWVRVRAAKGIVNFELGTSCKLAPAGGGDFTDRQKQLNANGGEFKGSSRSNVIKKSSKLDIDHQIKIYRTSFTEEDLKNIKE